MTSTASHHPPPRAAYLHVPFCVHRCGYCDFTVVAGRADLVPAWFDALAAELALLETPRPVETLFIGGGTPTWLEPPDLARLLELVTRWFPLAPGAEFSVEANPSGLDEPRIDALAAAGVNRVSLGVQSFFDRDLALLERDHTAATVREVVTLLRQLTGNLSCDLIFAVPGQSLADWQHNLETALELGFPHISTYGLTIEKGTTFWSRRKKGQLPAVPEALERDMYEAAMDRLPAAGLEQYEISSFARPGHRCRHNQVYWRGEPFFAAGPGAARYLNGSREVNYRSVTGWIRHVLAGDSPVHERETLTPADRARELLVLGLRMTDGISADEFRHRTGLILQEFAGSTITPLLEAGLLEHTADRLRLTREGRCLADSVAGEFLVADD